MKRPILVTSLIVFVLLSALQAIYYSIDSGTTLPGNGAGEFIIRKMIGIGLLAAIYSYTSKWWRYFRGSVCRKHGCSSR